MFITVLFEQIWRLLWTRELVTLSSAALVSWKSDELMKSHPKLIKLIKLIVLIILILHASVFSGRTTLVERGATQLGGETLVVEICKLLKGFLATHGLMGHVDLTDNRPSW